MSQKEKENQDSLRVPESGKPTDSTSSDKQHSTETLPIPAEKAYFLHKIEILGELKAEMLTWAKGRFCGIGVTSGHLTHYF